MFLSTFKTFPHMFPCTFFKNILEISIESCNLPFKVSKKIQLEPSPWSSMSYILSMWFVVLTCPGQPECRGLIRPSPWLITSSAYLIHFISIIILELNMCPTISHQTPVRWNTWAVCQRCWSRYDTYKYFLLVPI